MTEKLNVLNIICKTGKYENNLLQSLQNMKAGTEPMERRDPERQKKNTGKPNCT
jgi:hypothetical protein